VSLTMGQIRSDLLALQATLGSNTPSLWQHHILHEPPNSPGRQRYQKKVLPARRRSQIALILAERRGCDEGQAVQLLGTFIERGLPGLIDLRCIASSQSIQQTLVQRRIQRAINHHLGALRVQARQEIGRLIGHLYAAVGAIGSSFSILPLLTSHPSSPYRVRRSRRVWYGTAASIKRVQQRRARVRRRSLIRFAWQHGQQPQQAPRDQHGDRLVTEFAARVELSEEDARQRLRNLITYGGIGLLAEKDWKDAIDVRARECLHFFKLARVEGTVDWIVMRRQVNDYLSTFGLPSLSPQLVRAIYNYQPLPNFWHSGE